MLDLPLAGAVAISTPPHTDGNTADDTQVTVYGRFRMDGSYTVAGEATPYLVFSGGVARATMTWGDASFRHVSFEPGAVDPLPPGVNVPLFTRPGGISDAAALAAVRTGFQSCAAPVSSSADTSIPNCPQHGAVPPNAMNARWSLVGEPTQGARVSFDRERGAFTVDGTFAMTLGYDGGAVSAAGRYTATLSFDGTQVRLVNIRES